MNIVLHLTILFGISVVGCWAAPSNDECWDAEQLILPARVTGASTVDAIYDLTSDNGIRHCPDFLSIQGGIWYSVMGSGDTMIASTCHPETDFDTIISIYEGTNCDHLLCVDGNDDDKLHCPSNHVASTIYWESTLGVEYFIMVHGYDEEGTFGLSIDNLEYMARITRVVLVDSDTNHDIRYLDSPYEIIDLALDGRNLAVRAETAGAVRSVKFTFNDSQANNKLHSIENVPPFAYPGDIDGDYLRWNPQEQRIYRNEMTPYFQTRARGRPGIARTQFMEVVDNSYGPADEMKVTRFFLLDAAADRVLRELKDGDTIDLSKDGLSLAVRADVSGPVGQVQFFMHLSPPEGAPYGHIGSHSNEKEPPYVYPGNKGLDYGGHYSGGYYQDWDVKPGRLAIQATPFAEEVKLPTTTMDFANYEGAGRSLRIVVDVVDGTE